MSITAMKLALAFLQRVTHWEEGTPDLHDMKTTLRTAISEAEKAEPMAWMTSYGNLARADLMKSGAPFDDRADYTIPLFLAAGAQPAPKQEFIQPGYQLVPVEPTDKMVQASLHLDLSYMPLQEGYDRAAVYKAMLAAAPVQAQPAKPLTNSEIDEAIQQHVDPVATYRNLHEFARAIEAKVKEQS